MLIGEKDLHRIWLQNWVGIDEKDMPEFSRYGYDGWQELECESFGVVDPKFWTYISATIDYDDQKHSQS